MPRHFQSASQPPGSIAALNSENASVSIPLPVGMSCCVFSGLRLILQPLKFWTAFRPIASGSMMLKSASLVFP
ncbi:hypothetical protein D3C76_1592940 [compost metagenome]